MIILPYIVIIIAEAGQQIGITAVTEVRKKNTPFIHLGIVVYVVFYMSALVRMY